ncbi:DoxX family protein [Agrobacterium tumefaciens]|uniref:DoxX family protein n=1 Tax=Agrobacterium tumefaciens TaxID=358 RepID=UPI0021D00FF1|nr:DoxX family protein [Agrobacterium tumefaciens]UXS01063.1 DoxX family protein [Agrobacterium tumefaciens]
MTTDLASTRSLGGALTALHRHVECLLASIPQSLPLLALRLGLAVPFFKSGLTKWDGFLTLSTGARYLFEQEFRLHIFGSLIPYPMPLVMAAASGIAELVLPVLLVLGLFTRYAALGLLVMTAVIQLTVPDGWANFHLPWAAMALTLVVYGGGRIALDALLNGHRS